VPREARGNPLPERLAPLLETELHHPALIERVETREFAHLLIVEAGIRRQFVQQPGPGRQSAPDAGAGTENQYEIAPRRALGKDVADVAQS